ncbi:transposase [Sulfitobacter guttiformis]|uniref:transposase n=1 Tax=Sulfitobacter guttiformis TaxID=74349 RepID=UPI000E70C5C9
MESLMKRVRQDWHLADFATLCRRQNTLPVSIPYKGPTGANVRNEAPPSSTASQLLVYLVPWP